MVIMVTMGEDLCRTLICVEVGDAVAVLTGVDHIAGVRLHVIVEGWKIREMVVVTTIVITVITTKEGIAATVGVDHVVIVVVERETGEIEKDGIEIVAGTQRGLVKDGEEERGMSGDHLGTVAVAV